MEWVSIPESVEPRKFLPLDCQFLSLWKGAICLVEFDVDDNCFYLSMYPSSHPSSMKVDREREKKFTHFCKLERPKNY